MINKEGTIAVKMITANVLANICSKVYIKLT
jgi:hypothetical protein